MKWFNCTFVALALAVGGGCSNKNANYDALEAKQLNCPDGAQLEFRPWGKDGLMAICQIRHGPVAMAEDGHVVLQGAYSMDKKHGEWKWLDSSGNVVRTEQN